MSTSSPSAAPRRYRALVPVKSWARAKTRLGLSPAQRARLALAFATDTLQVLAATPQVEEVVVVTDSASAPDELPGAWRFFVDPDARGLNDALLRASAALGDDDIAVLAVCADLPALRSADVGAVLAAADEAGGGAEALNHGWFVADAAGVGTTVLAAPHHTGFHPTFGAGSREAHRGLGLRDLSGSASIRLRQDVDTLDDLQRVRRLGVGPATLTALTELGLV
ncbi:2-phospho-L-lactate guanylyltransferase [Nocardioides massiliensis]|uniref:Phosphoenolpyruvate guanylyltransferase n=2 Tax=Nocardioides massiliensis TaxID=1325935 RepID=A0ABT9NQ98_9ACTN|nr:2-phospho-L-lactate guanylyltransferase [Nocardioides massiliensis]MDP9822543.1 2-phospho-L-lactate guanylyltransferase [Nocardioides massiliensis]